MNPHHSGIWRNVPAPLSWGLKLIVKAFFKTPEQGAQTTIHLAVSDEFNGVSGKYFMDCAVRIIVDLLKLDLFPKKLQYFKNFKPVVSVGQSSNSACFFAKCSCSVGYGPYGSFIDIEPLIMIARWNNPLDIGETMCNITLNPPTLQPDIVTLSGSPPKAAIPH
ncbi:hypothetical protein DBV15_07940, partial [Temnothorax longispinosus]